MRSTAAGLTYARAMTSIDEMAALIEHGEWAHCKKFL
jgi:hypothetical protein